MTNAWGRSRPLFFILSYYKMEAIMARAWRKKNQAKRRQKALDNLFKNNSTDAVYGDERRRKEVEILKTRLAQAGVSGYVDISEYADGGRR